MKETWGDSREYSNSVAHTITSKGRTGCMHKLWNCTCALNLKNNRIQKARAKQKAGCTAEVDTFIT
jgi:hypothetical protein